MYRRLFFHGLKVTLIVSLLMTPLTKVKAADSGFSLQVTPSPLITSVKPGEVKTVELKIRNVNTEPERLKMGLRSFSSNGSSDNINLSDQEGTEVDSWVSFKEPVFSIEAGEWYTQNVTFNTPEDAGFSYSFAITISRESEETPVTGATAIQGTVAIFTLLSIERSDAKRSFAIDNIRLDRNVFEYLPVKIDVNVKNGGNTFVQPRGNIFIQRHANDSEPISVLPLNEAGSYVLPGTERTLSASWVDGFPLYITKDGKTSLSWDWNKLSHLRFGKYTIKIVGVYDDGQRDVPVEAQTTFWVIPWKLLLVSILLISLTAVGVFTTIKKFYTVGKRKRRHEIKVR